MAEVLIAGIYLADQPNNSRELIKEFKLSTCHNVVQRWGAIAADPSINTDLPFTTLISAEKIPKTALINRLIGDAVEFEWLILCDDDIEVEPGFLDRFLNLSEKYNFSISQPARTLDSFIDHPIVQVLPGITARQTRFVEIGPLVCMHRDAITHLLPFKETDGMGWGLDMVWPVIAERQRLRMGIVDATPIAHRMRPPAGGYNRDGAVAEMTWTLANREHLAPEDAFTVLEVFL